VVELVSRATSTTVDVPIDQVLHQLKTKIAEETLLEEIAD
jgi:hypothetical protein